MTETYRVRWVVDPGHGWLEVDLDEALEAARSVRPISACSYVDLDKGLAYLEEDCDAGVWLEWVAGSSDDDAVRAVALGVEGFHHCDGLAWVRDLESWSWFEVLEGGDVVSCDRCAARLDISRADGWENLEALEGVDLDVIVCAGCVTDAERARLEAVIWSGFASEREYLEAVTS